VWYDGFCTHQDLVGKDETPVVERLKQLNGAGNELSLFMCNDDVSNGPCEADAIQRFCKNVSLDEIEHGIGQAGSRRACWIDERNSADLTGEGNSRSCENMLTATGLLRRLRQPVRAILAAPTVLRYFHKGAHSQLTLLLTPDQRYNHEKYPDAERRLM
jgi:hypothetical protein